MLNPVTPEFLARLTAQCGADVLRPDGGAFSADPRGRVSGIVGAVVAPRSTAEVSVIMAAAHDARVGVIPFGGGTGLVLGQVMGTGPAPLVISFERMTAIRHIDAAGGVLVAEAGAILADVQTAAENVDRLFPLSLASEGSCRIGGNLATNAGGLNVLRYGNTRDLVLGVEAVMADGTVINGLKHLRKDNTGYDLRHLLIGSEGTLGIITAASLRLFARPRGRATAVISVASPRAALDLLGIANDLAAGSVSAFELISGVGLSFLEQHFSDIRRPLGNPDWSVLIDLGTGTDDAGARDLMMAIFEAGMATELCDDGVIASSERERMEFWAMRETIPLGNKKIGAVVSHDISLPLGRLPEFIDQASGVIAGLGDYRINCFGHLGDGNLHFNIFPPACETRDAYMVHADQIQREVHDLVAEFDGSFSAEHGLGRLKAGELLRYGDAGKLAAMRAIKAAMDPHGILNPGAVLAP